MASAPFPISTLDLTQLIDSGGTFPEPGPGPATNVMALVRTLAYGGPAYGAQSCDGQLLPVPNYQPLFSLLGTSYGGDGEMHFALPNLRQKSAIGGGTQQQAPTAEAQPMTYMIAVEGDAGDAAFPMLGAIGLFAALHPPAGWLVADGSILPLMQYVPLFEVIGTAFGGNGETTVQLPDLNGCAAVGAGRGASASIALGQQVAAGPDTPVACLGLNYIINVSGSAPPSSGNGGFPDSSSVLGEVIAFAGANIPGGWLPADGREMLVADNQALFELIGTTFGGEGETSFCLPDARVRMVVGT